MEDRSNPLSKWSDGWTQYLDIIAFFRVGSRKKKEREKKEITYISYVIEFKGYVRYF